MEQLAYFYFAVISNQNPALTITFRVKLAPFQAISRVKAS